MTINVCLRATSAIDRAIGRNVRERRQALGLTLEQLAFGADIRIGDLREGEAGDHRFKADELFRLTKALAISFEDLLPLREMSKSVGG